MKVGLKNLHEKAPRGGERVAKTAALSDKGIAKVSASLSHKLLRRREGGHKPTEVMTGRGKGRNGCNGSP